LRKRKPPGIPTITSIQGLGIVKLRFSCIDTEQVRTVGIEKLRTILVLSKLVIGELHDCTRKLAKKQHVYALHPRDEDQAERENHSLPRLATLASALEPGFEPSFDINARKKTQTKVHSFLPTIPIKHG
jgi:hypothetical protein